MKKCLYIVFAIAILFLEVNGVSAKECVYCNGSYLPYELSELSRNIINLIQLFVPVIIIITGIVELAKSVIAGDEKKMDEAKPKLLRKFIAGIIIFLVFAIVKLGIGFLGSNSSGFLECASYFINEEGEKVSCPDRGSLSAGNSTSNGSSSSSKSSSSNKPDAKNFGKSTEEICKNQCLDVYNSGGQAQYNSCYNACMNGTSTKKSSSATNNSNSTIPKGSGGGGGGHSF